jgi:hypothetical protein
MTVTDFSASAAHNARVATAIHAERFWRTVLSAYGNLPAAQR